MNRWAWRVIFALVLSHPEISAAGHHHSTASQSIEQAGVSVEAQVLDSEQTSDIFDLNLIERGIQPIVITVHNASAQTYHFAKADVDSNFIPATVAAKAAYENPVVVSSGVVGRAVSAIPRWILPHHTTAPRPLLNRDIQANFVREEIKDADITPNSSLSGFLFTHPQTSQGPLHVNLMNVQTHTWLEFDIPAQVAPVE